MYLHWHDGFWLDWMVDRSHGWIHDRLRGQQHRQHGRSLRGLAYLQRLPELKLR
jgi:hypothetical protein